MGLHLEGGAVRALARPLHHRRSAPAGAAMGAICCYTNALAAAAERHGCAGCVMIAPLPIERCERNNLNSFPN